MVWGDVDVSFDDFVCVYLDVNCLYCYSEVGLVDMFGFYLELDMFFGFSLGVCKLLIVVGSGIGN